MRKFVITLVVLAVLLVAADFGLRAYAESRAADAINSELGRDVQPDVSIEGFPFLLHAIQGSYPEVIMTASTAAGSITGVHAVLDLSRVTLPLRDALAGDTSNLAARSASLQALLPLDSLAAALGRPDVILSAGPDGGVLVSSTLSVAGRAIPVSGTASIGISDDTVTISVPQFTAAGVNLTPLATAAAAALARGLTTTLPLTGLPFTITDATVAVQGTDLVLSVTTGAFAPSDLR